MSFSFLFIYLNILVYILVNDFYMYFHIDYKALEMFIVFFLLIYFQVMVSEKSRTLKSMRKYKLFKIKNKNNLVNKNFLLFASNSTISNLSIKLF